jgi:regulatory protein
MKEIDITPQGIYKEDEQIKKAREKALLFLSYGDHTVKSMYEKLTGAGFDKDICDTVIAYLVERKYINEADYLERFMRHCAYKKKYGRKRIELAAYQKGFSKKVIGEIAEEVFCEIDFVEICAERLQKTDIADLTDKKKRDKIIASLMRSGFSLNEIKSAINSLCDE